MVATMSEYRQKMDSIHEYLGGSCKHCGSKDNLQVDHVNHEDKNFNVAANWGLSWDNLKPELDKCQLLCKDCHLAKSISEGSLAKGWTNQPRIKHGTVWSYTRHGCRCDDCRAAKSIAMHNEYMRKKNRV